MMIIIISMFCYILACVFPCVITNHGTIMGIECLLGGPLTIFADFTLFMIWLSNIIFFINYILFVRKKRAYTMSSAISLLLCFSFLLESEIPCLDIHGDIIDYGVGFYFWCISYILQFILLFYSDMHLHEKGEIPRL